MIITQFPLLASMIAPVFTILTPVSASIAGGAFAPILGSGIVGSSVLGSAVPPAVAPVFASFIGGEIFNLIRQTGAVAQVVLVILLIFSIFSWSVILTKWSSIKRARAQSGRFLRAFRKAQRLQDVAAVSEQFKPSPLVAVFDNAYDEYRRQGDSNINAVQRAAQIHLQRS